MPQQLAERQVEKSGDGKSHCVLCECLMATEWDRLLVLVSPPLKSLLKGPPPSFQGIPPIWSAGLFQKASSPTATCVQASSHRLERPTILQYSDFRRELLESTEEGSCWSLQKKGKLLTASQAKTWFQRNKTGCHAPKTSLS